MPESRDKPSESEPEQVQTCQTGVTLQEDVKIIKLNLLFLKFWQDQKPNQRLSNPVPSRTEPQVLVKETKTKQEI